MGQMPSNTSVYTTLSCVIMGYSSLSATYRNTQITREKIKVSGYTKRWRNADETANGWQDYLNRLRTARMWCFTPPDITTNRFIWMFTISLQLNILNLYLLSYFVMLSWFLFHISIVYSLRVEHCIPFLYIWLLQNTTYCMVNSTQLSIKCWNVYELDAFVSFILE